MATDSSDLSIEIDRPSALFAVLSKEQQLVPETIFYNPPSKHFEEGKPTYHVWVGPEMGRGVVPERHNGVFLLFPNILRSKLIPSNPSIDTFISEAVEGMMDLARNAGIRENDDHRLSAYSDIGYFLFSPRALKSRPSEAHTAFVNIRLSGGQPYYKAHLLTGLQLPPSAFADELAPLIGELCRLGSTDNWHSPFIRALNAYVSEFYVPELRKF